MKDSANRVFQESIRGGMVLTPKALSVAIRQAMKECADNRGRISISDIYELTSYLENLNEAEDK